MNICFLLPNDKDSLKKWDSFVNQHPYGWLTQHSTWADILINCFTNVYPFRLVVANSDNNEIIAGLPLFLINSSFAGRRLIGAPMATFFDPLVTTCDDFDILLKKALDLKEATGSSLLKIKTLNSKTILHKSNYSAINNYITHVLDLEGDLQSIWKRFDRTCIRKNIKRASQHDIKFTIIFERANIKIFFKLYSNTRKQHGLPSIPLRFFQAIFDTYVTTNNAYFLMAEYKGTPIASLLVFIYKNKCSAEALGWDIQYKWLSPSILIYWEAIKLAHSAGCRLFDFGRTAVTNKSLIAFKRRWGTEEIEMPIYTYSSGTQATSLIRKSGSASKIANIMFRSSPPPFYNILSNFFYRHYCE